MTCSINPHILRYIEIVENGEVRACAEQKQLVAMVRRAFETEDIYTDDEQVEKYLGLAKYFPYDEVFPWEQFVFALHMCTYRGSDNRPRWPDLFLLIGRGAGKDGYIALESMAAVSPYCGIANYDVDICANSEEQAKTPFMDVHGVLECPSHTRKLKRFFYWNLERIQGIKTKACIRYRTNNPKGKDGLRSGMVVFNEIHQYENYDNINVFTTGLGKKKHPRRLYATTNGFVRGGPLDDYLAQSLDILAGRMDDGGLLPFICRLDNADEVHDPKNWAKANPSLPYRPDLAEEIAKEYREWIRNPANATSFMTKRMNLPETNKDLEVTSWDNILAASQEPPNVTGKAGVLALDFALIGDMLTAGALIPTDGMYIWESHSWICRQSKDWHRIKAPLAEWANLGLLTIVDDAEINPELMVEWVEENLLGKYSLPVLSIDKFRWPLVLKAFARLGYSTEQKNVRFIRPSDQALIAPVIISAFTNHQILWGENPLMRWATNNAKLVSEGVNKGRGNYTFGKIEPKSRKTDPFMALVAGMCAAGDVENTELCLDLPDVATY